MTRTTKEKEKEGKGKGGKKEGRVMTRLETTGERKASGSAISEGGRGGSWIEEASCNLEKERG